jgi:hypothetical protein
MHSPHTAALLLLAVDWGVKFTIDLTEGRIYLIHEDAPRQGCANIRDYAKMPVRKIMQELCKKAPGTMTPVSDDSRGYP